MGRAGIVGVGSGVRVRGPGSGVRGPGAIRRISAGPGGQCINLEELDYGLEDAVTFVVVRKNWEYRHWLLILYDT